LTHSVHLRHISALNDNIFATFYAILVKIGPLTPEITPSGVYITFGTRRQKSAYLTKYPSKYWTELHQLFSLDYKTETSFAVHEKTLLW